MNIDDILMKIAGEEGVNLSEIKEEIKLVIERGIKSSDPRVREFWRSVPCAGDKPTTEELIVYILEQLKEDNR